MKAKPYSSVMSLLPPAHSFCVTAVVALGLTFLPATAGAQTVVTSFENPPFANNTVLDGSGGWTGSTGSGATTNLAATNAQAYNGSQSLRAINGSGTSYYAVSPNLYSLNSTELSLFFMNPTTTFASGANIARFEIYYNSTLNTTLAENSRIIMTLQYGVESSDAFRLQFSGTGVASTVTRNLVNSTTLNLSNWNEILISLDLSGPTETVSVSVGGFDVNLPVNLAAAADDNSRISYLRLATNTGGNGTTYFDYATVIPVPEPSAALLCVGTLGLIALRRRKHLR